MKQMVLAIFVLLGTQPLPALGCDMHADQPMAVEHQHVISQDMNDMADMDCCDEDTAEAPDHCTSMSQCGTCAPSLTALVAFFSSAGPGNTTRLAILSRDKTTHLYYAPLFRPPIS